LIDHQPLVSSNGQRKGGPGHKVAAFNATFDPATRGLNDPVDEVEALATVTSLPEHGFLSPDELESIVSNAPAHLHRGAMF
jgi:hypothetical protein